MQANRVITQNPLTVITDIIPAQRQALSDLLTEIGQDVNRNQYLRFKEIETTHFARFVMIGGGKLSDRDDQTRLYFSANFDGNWEDYIDLLVDKAGPGVEAIFSKCANYPGYKLTDPAFKSKFKEYIKAHTIYTDTFYQGYPHKSVQQVKAAIETHQKLSDFLNQKQMAGLMDALASLSKKPNEPGMLLQVWELVKGVPQKYLFPSLLELLKKLQHVELDNNVPLTPSEPVNTRPEVTEWFYTVQNEMTVVSDITDGKVEYAKRFLMILDFLGKNIFNNGSLGGISTIHFARWAVIDGGKNLLFESNYDGNWEQYIGDFVDKASVGMDLIWSNCNGYPKRGSQDLQAFKQIIIDHQVRAHVFYSAYRFSSCRNILNDLAISENLGKLVANKEFANLLPRL